MNWITEIFRLLSGGIRQGEEGTLRDRLGKTFWAFLHVLLLFGLCGILLLDGDAARAALCLSITAMVLILLLRIYRLFDF